MRNTQEFKLAKVLEYGSISSVTDTDILQHPEWGDVELPAYVFTPREEHKDDQDTVILGKCHTGPFRLIDIMFDWLVKEESEL